MAEASEGAEPATPASPTPASATPTRVHPANKAIAASFARLDALLDTAMGRTADGERVPIDDQTIASAKGRLLLEISRLTLPKDAPLDPELAEQARALRAKLIEEQRVLQRRMDAAQVISGLIADAVLEAESDGTYRPHGALTAPGPQRITADATRHDEDPTPRPGRQARTREVGA